MDLGSKFWDSGALSSDDSSSAPRLLKQVVSDSTPSSILIANLCFTGYVILNQTCFALTYRHPKIQETRRRAGLKGMFVVCGFIIRRDCLYTIFSWRAASWVLVGKVSKINYCWRVESEWRLWSVLSYSCPTFGHSKAKWGPAFFEICQIVSNTFVSVSRLHSLMYPFIWISIKHTGKGRDTISETSSGTRLFRSSQMTLLHSLITMSKLTILVLWPNNTHWSYFYSSTVRVLSEYFNLFVLTGFVRSKVRVSKAGCVSHCLELSFPHHSPCIPRRWEIPSKPKHMRSYYSEVMDTRMSSSWFSSCSPKLLLIFCFLRCVFYGDLYPNKECYNENTARNIALLIEARKKFAYGPTTDYLAEKNCIGFVRKGDATHQGCAVILSNKEDG